MFLWKTEPDIYTNRNLNLSAVHNETTALLKTKILWNVALSGLTSVTTFDVFLTVHHSIDFSKYQLSAQFF